MSIDYVVDKCIYMDVPGPHVYISHLLMMLRLKIDVVLIVDNV